jgi:hypothetical protein
MSINRNQSRPKTTTAGGRSHNGTIINEDNNNSNLMTNTNININNETS